MPCWRRSAHLPVTTGNAVNTVLAYDPYHDSSRSSCTLNNVMDRLIRCDAVSIHSPQLISVGVPSNVTTLTCCNTVATALHCKTSRTPHQISSRLHFFLCFFFFFHSVSTIPFHVPATLLPVLRVATISTRVPGGQWSMKNTPPNFMITCYDIRSDGAMMIVPYRC